MSVWESLHLCNSVCMFPHAQRFENFNEYIILRAAKAPMFPGWCCGFFFDFLFSTQYDISKLITQILLSLCSSCTFICQSSTLTSPSKSLLNTAKLVWREADYGLTEEQSEKLLHPVKQIFLSSQLVTVQPTWMLTCSGMQKGTHT